MLAGKGIADRGRGRIVVGKGEVDIGRGKMVREICGGMRRKKKSCREQRSG
jgi:hypothetical protein